MASTAEIPTQFTQEPIPEEIKYLKTSNQIKLTSRSYKRKVYTKAKASSEHLQQDQSQLPHNSSQMQSNHNVMQNNSE
jgi:hypothetical protein